MKFLKTKNQYKASNVVFDIKKNEASSYDWWVFFKTINGKNVFNNYNYSNTTTKHQYKIMELLEKLDIKIDLYISTKLSLGDESCLSDSIESLKLKNKSLNELINKKGTKKEKNNERKKQIKENEEKILEIKKLGAIK